MSPKPPPRDPPDAVIILRSGYATETLWREAIASALAYERAVIAIDAAGQRIDPKEAIR